MVPLVFYQCQSSQMFADMKYVPLRPLRRTGTAPAVSLEVHWKSFEWFHLLSMLIIANCNVSELHSCLLIWNMGHWDHWEGLAPDRKAAPGFIAACDASEVLLKYYFRIITSEVLHPTFFFWITQLSEQISSHVLGWEIFFQHLWFRFCSILTHKELLHILFILTEHALEVSFFKNQSYFFLSIQMWHLCKHWFNCREKKENILEEVQSTIGT